MGKKRKPVPITSKAKIGGGVKRKRDAAGAGGAKVKGADKWWGCASLVHKQAASVVGKVLSAAERSRGVNVKGLTLAEGVQAQKATHAVVCQTLKFLPVIKKVVEAVDLLEDNPRLRPALAYVLAYEVLAGQGCKPKGPAERAVLKTKDALQDSLKEHLTAVGVEKLEDFSPNEQATVKRPRYVRVNLLKTTVKAAVKQLKKAFEVEVDTMLPDVLKLPPGAALHDHALVNNGSIVLQGYGSCMCAHALSPTSEWHILDACAAPGNKTLHLASLMRGKGAILALDRDQHRFKRLARNVELSGAKNVEVKQMDFLSHDPNENGFGPVQGILLDPSCSGSGTSVSRMDHLLPVKGDGDKERVAKLAEFQVSALRHALSFPQAARIVYSTCSIHEEENELVVNQVLPFAKEQGFELRNPFPTWHRRGLPLFEECEKLVRTDPKEDDMDGFFLALFERDVEHTTPSTAKASNTELEVKVLRGKPKKKKRKPPSTADKEPAPNFEAKQSGKKTPPIQKERETKSRAKNRKLQT